MCYLSFLILIYRFLSTGDNQEADNEKADNVKVAISADGRHVVSVSFTARSTLSSIKVS